MAREEFVDPSDLIIVGLDTEDREEHPLFDPRAFRDVDQNLVKNILVYGVLHPVIIRKEAGKKYVVDGRQRVKAAREAVSLTIAAGEYSVKVPVRETKGEDTRIAGIMISANEQRKDDSVLEKAFKAAHLMALTGEKEDEVAVAFGRSITTIRNWLKLVQADARIHAAIKAESISTQAGVELSKLPREEQVEALDKLLSAMTGGRVPESAAKQLREEKEAEAAASKAGSGKEKVDDVLGDAQPTRAGGKRKAVQSGVTRGWLRKALKTAAAKNLTEDHLKLLQWIATGESEKGSWYDDFMWAATAEMNDD